MYIPSERILGEMQSVQGLIRYVPSTGDNDFTLLVKSLTPSIKAAITGCTLDLYLGKRENYLCIGIKIHDVPDMPLIVYTVQKSYEEHVALYNCLKNRRFPICLFNEMNICVAWSYFNLSEDSAQEALDLLDNIDVLYVGNSNKNTAEALDDFRVLLDEPLQQKQSDMHILSFRPETEDWHCSNSYFLSLSDYNAINIGDAKEGPNFEKTIWSSFSWIIPEHVYKSPQIRIGKKEREFTDVFAYYEYGSFIVETKDLSVLSAGYNRSKEKRLAGIKKQVSKAIQQLIGSATRFSDNYELFDSDHNLIEVERNTPPHCIVLVTELMKYGDWNDIVDQLLEASKSTKAYFHLLDVTELTTLIMASDNKPELFDYHLINRFELFVNTKNLFIVSQIDDCSI